MPRGNYGAAPLGALIVFVLAAVALASLSSWTIFLIFVAVAIGVALAVGNHLSKPQCPKCNSRRRDYTYLRTDGQPDLRYRPNPIRCTSCGTTFN